MGVYKYDESYIGKKYNYLTITGFGYGKIGDDSNIVFGCYESNGRTADFN